MNLALKQRLVGAIVLMALAVIFLPMLLDGSGTPDTLDVEVEIPERSEAPESRFEEPDVAAELSEPVREDDIEEPESGSESGAEAGTGESESGDDTEAPAVSGWVVQVGSFSRESNARVLRDRLRDQGYDAFVNEGESGGDAVWRVRVGPMPEEAEAREVAQALEDERGQPALVMSHP